MFLVTNRLTVNEGWGVELERRFAERAGQIEREPGFIRMCVMRPVLRRKDRTTGQWTTKDGPGVYQIQTWWESEEAFWAWTQSESFRAAHKNRPDPDMYAGPASMEIHELVQHAQSDETS